MHILFAFILLAADGPVTGHQLTWLRMPFQDHYWAWKFIGGLGMVTFTARFAVQWLYSEYHKESRVPVAFWWLSLSGTLLLLAYALRQQDSIFILGYVFNVIPYSRNLMLIYRKRRLEGMAGFPIPAPVPAAAAEK